MGWVAINKNQEVLREDEHGRPVQAGEEGNLLFIMQEDFGRKVAVDLLNGAIIIDYDHWEINPNTGLVDIYNPRTIFHICDETNILGGLFDTVSTEPNEEGIVFNTFVPLVWRPIWFSRITNGDPTKVIGAQTTLPPVYGGKNIKKMVSIFSSGELGID